MNTFRKIAIALALLGIVGVAAVVAAKSSQAAWQSCDANFQCY